MKEFLFVEKYRPQTIEDCILPEGLKETFRKIVEKGELPNMMFTGSADLGIVWWRECPPNKYL